MVSYRRYVNNTNTNTMLSKKYIEAKNKAAAAKLLNCSVENVKSITEYANSYYVVLFKGRSTFISKAKLIAIANTSLLYWMQDFKAKNLTTITVWINESNNVLYHDKLDYTNLEIALNIYRTYEINENNILYIGYAEFNNYGYYKTHHIVNRLVKR